MLRHPAFFMVQLSHPYVTSGKTIALTIQTFVSKVMSFSFNTLCSVLKDIIFIPIPKKSNAKDCANYRTIALISHASKIVLKILQARLQQNMNQEHPDIQAGYIHWMIEKTREFQKKTHTYLCFIYYSL